LLAQAVHNYTLENSSNYGLSEAMFYTLQKCLLLFGIQIDQNLSIYLKNSG